MFFDDKSHNYTGVVTKIDRNKHVCGNQYKIELMLGDTVVDTGCLTDWERDTFPTRARQMYDDMVEGALAIADGHTSDGEKEISDYEFYSYE